MLKDVQPRWLAALTQVEWRLNQAESQDPLLIWTTDGDLRITSLRGSALGALSVDTNELTGACVADLFPPASAEHAVVAAHRRALAGESPQLDVTWANRRFEAALKPLRDAQGTVAGVTGTVRARRELEPGASYPYSEERLLRSLFENSSEMVALLDRDGQIFYSSPNVTRVLGYRPEEFVGRDGFEFIHRDDARQIRRALALLLKSPGTAANATYRVRARDGSWKWVEGTATNLLEEPGVRAVVINNRDVTERRRAEAERQVIFEIIHGVNATSNLDELLVLIHGALRKVIYAENCFVALYDRATGMFHFPFFVDQFDTVPPPQKVGKSCTAYVFKTGWPMLIPQSAFDELAARGEVELVGTPSPAWLGVPLRTPAETIGVLVVQHYENENAYTERDLDFLASVGGQIALAIERKRAEDTLRKQQEEQQIIFNSAPSMIWYRDQDNCILRANRAAAQALGLKVDEVEGRLFSDVYPGNSEALHRADLEVIRTGLPKFWMVETFQTASGQVRLLRSDRIPYRNQAGDIIGVIVFSTDITEQQRAEEALRRSEANYRSLVQGAPYGICRVNEEGKILDANPSLVEMLGYGSESELLAVRMDEDVCAELRNHTESWGQRLDRPLCQEMEWKRKDGTSLTVRVSSRPVRDAQTSAVCCEIIAENVTEQRLLETQLRQAQKMEAIGQLAGGVAHDFNNLLMVIKGHTELLLERLEQGNGDYHKVEQIQHAADRAVSLTRQLLAFGRMQVLQPKVLDLNSVVAELGRILPRLIGENIELAILTRPGLGRVKADPVQIEQVLLNLAVNARDAMPGGGKLLIETSDVELDVAYARRHPPVAPGRYVMLAVSDTGVGMDAATQAHVFEPFFTTKEKGKGTGLGLATVYGVVKQSGGYIWLYSEPGKGTTFKIYFPRVEQPADCSGQAREVKEPPAGTETILLAEDERDVREIANEFLSLSGYSVLEAANGDEALKIAARHAGPIHLLVTDMVMPGMGGRELAGRLRAMRPEVKVIYMSGYTDYSRTREGELEDDAVLVSKPFSRSTLGRMVRDVLQGSRSKDFLEQ